MIHTILIYLGLSAACTLCYIAGAGLSRQKWYDIGRQHGDTEGYSRGYDRGIDIGWNQGREYQLKLSTQPRDKTNGQFLSRGRR